MRTLRWMIAGAVAMALTGCGSDEISSAGASGDVVINNPPPTTTPPPTTGPGAGQPADSCPDLGNGQVFADDGTITGPSGTYRVCSFPDRITASATINAQAGVIYSMRQRVDVGNDLGAAPTAGETPVVLTIRPGVVVYAQSGIAWLAVNRGNRIQAVGTATQPIIFTSRANVAGEAADTDQGQWGGVVLMGRAPVTDCSVPAATPGTVDCVRQTEGATNPALYGGATPDDNSGTLSYVQIRYSGYVLSANSELQALTLEGVGSGTRIDHIQMHNSSDDGFENFGGRAHMRHLVVTGADDDSVDLDMGYKGTIQYLIAIQKGGTPDSMIELDSTNALEAQTPRTNAKIANFTFVHRGGGSNGAAMLFRGAADVALINGVLTTGTPCLRYAGLNILDAADAATDNAGAPIFRSVAMQCGATAFLGNTAGNAPIDATQVAANFAAGTNVSSTFTASLTNGYVNGVNEAALVATDPRTVDSAFDTTSYVGAVRDANDTWYAGWTCNSSTANFGTTSGNCTSLPAPAAQ